MEKLKELKQQYENLSVERDKTKDKMRELENINIIVEYNQLCKKLRSLENMLLDCNRNLKFEEYSNCQHILVCTKYEYDGYEGRTYRSYGCIKCGLDESIYDESREILNHEDQIKYDYLKQRYPKLGGQHLDILCDVSLAQLIYSKIKEEYPNLNDKQLIKLFKGDYERLISEKEKIRKR